MRLFPVVGKAIRNKMKRNAEKAGVKRIRVHDFRHSHTAYLINKNIEPLLIKERLGHKDITDFVKKQKEIEGEYRKLELSNKEKDIIEKYMDAMFENDIAYGPCAYKTGFLDCLVILKQLGLIDE